MTGIAAGVAAAYTEADGTVTTFDDHVGAGTVTGGPAGETWFFHCTRIADGSRTVPVGAAVRFRLVPGPTGLEAVDLRVR